MDRALKITLAVLVFLAGTSFALLDRRPASESLGLRGDNGGQLVLRGPRWNLPPKPKAVSGPLPSANTKASPLPPKSTVLTPIDTGQPPPRLAKVFPRHESTGDSPWGSAIGHRLPVADQGALVLHRLPTHRIVDGDTLEELARRYLGDSSRGIEIYEANRHLLLGPSVLPIGVELVIPQGGALVRHPKGLLPDKPLIPVAPATK